MRPYRFSINTESVALVPPFLEHKHFRQTHFSHDQNAK